MSGSSKTKILVTGDNGFVGKVLQAVAAENPYSDRLVLLPASEMDESGKFDITDEQQVNRLIAKAEPDSVIHLAAIASPRDAFQNPNLAWDVNFNGSRYLANAIIDKCPSSRLIAVSTSEVYGKSVETIDGRINEETPCEPLSVYGATKTAMEIALGQMAKDGLNLVTFRPFNHTCPGQDPMYVVAKLTKFFADLAAGREEPELVIGDPEVARDFTDARDIVRAYLDAALVADIPAAVKINLCSGNSRSIKSIIETLQELSGQRVSIVSNPEFIPKNQVMNICGDASKARQQLAWQADIPFEQTIKEMMDYWR